MDELSIRICSDEDLYLLAGLNEQLIEDEQHDNQMNVEQLKARMHHFLHTEYKAYLFENGDQVIGYALVKHTDRPLYLRHFFIGRESRRKGFGKSAFRKLLQALDTDQIDIEVLYWNKAAYSFWSSLGFKERSVAMRLENGHEKSTQT
ncbi:GNAT family N-acetyltransferase [Paenibacillus sp. NPDC058071]|uniref:GNAT family N-acetyltransferase n=1 Tax=Paenibacillus sp. NPDC058071 TaxID=3346326 RepID=UPI0036D82747